MAKPSATDIIAAANKVGVTLLHDDAVKLANGGQLSPDRFTQSKRFEADAPTCSGIKIIDLGGGCGLYLNFPAMISVCCQT
jgi:hypothetical protein